MTEFMPPEEEPGDLTPEETYIDMVDGVTITAVEVEFTEEGGWVNALDWHAPVKVRAENIGWILLNSSHILRVTPVTARQRESV